MPAPPSLRLLAAALLLLGACTGGTWPEGHRFAGRWSGTFNFVPVAGTGFLAQAGTVSLLIREDGRFDGQIRLASGETTTDLSGTVSPHGALAGRMERFALHGSLELVARGRVRGTTTQLLDGAPVATVSIDLAGR